MENKRTPHFQFCLETAFLGEKHTKSMEWKAPSPGSKCSFSGWYVSPGLLTCQAGSSCLRMSSSHTSVGGADASLTLHHKNSASGAKAAIRLREKQPRMEMSLRLPQPSSCNKPKGASGVGDKTGKHVWVERAGRPGGFAFLARSLPAQ